MKEKDIFKIVYLLFKVEKYVWSFSDVGNWKLWIWFLSLDFVREIRFVCN